MYKQTLAILLILVSSMAFGFTDDDDFNTRKSYRQECLQISKYSLGKTMKVNCYYNYHHFNTTAVAQYYNRTETINSGKMKIAEFNVLHPGMSKTRYKDYKKIAQIINRWDVVGVTELLPLISNDEKHNNALLKFLDYAPAEIKKIKEQLSSLNKKIKSTKSLRSIKRTKSKIDVLKIKLASLEKDLVKAPSLYRDPGYIKILKALRRMRNGKEWSLILSPRGQAAKKSDVQELVGYFYRASRVKPKVSKYCKKFRTYDRGTPVACIPNMGKALLGQDKKDVFSRRPFMAEFISGRFSFTLLASHVIYNSPKEPKLMENILMKSFGVKHYSELGTGATIKNYARFAEVKVMLEFMQELRSEFSQQDVILLGDLNLESKNKFWPNVLPTMPGVEIYVDDKTSMSESRYNKAGEETLGLANNYDHFLFDPTETDECIGANGKSDAKVINFYNDITGKYVRRLYQVRNDNRQQFQGDYSRNSAKYKLLVKRFLGPYQDKSKINETFGTKILGETSKKVRVKGIIEDVVKTQKYIEGFIERVLETQFDNKTYYSFYKQILSDHMPIAMSCSTN